MRVAIALAAVGNAVLAQTISRPGQSSTIPEWRMQSSSKIGNDLAKLSQADVDVASWYRVSSRSTIMAGLLANGVYTEKDLFFSNNLDTKVDYSMFTVPWIYRHQFSLQPVAGQHYFLHTHGISSKADIFLNGKKVIDSFDHAGAYVGQKLDITKFVAKGKNALVIQTYPTNYNKDFALGFVDWNPYSPDRGSGVWRDVELKQSGPVSISAPRIVTDFKDPKTKQVKVTVKVDVQNHESKAIKGKIDGAISEESGAGSLKISQSFNIGASQKQTLSLTATIANPKVWWPREWGAQPLYKTKLAASVDGKLSDESKETAFGIRHVTSTVNSYEDRTFYVNGQRFQVRGGGYTSDIFLRLDMEKLKKQFDYVLDLGFNTVRLEGKQEHPELYDLADRMGIMLMNGWECCDKWEAWSYNQDVEAELWSDRDYGIANKSMRHEAEMMQAHPSMLTFLIGSDYWPDDRATPIYVGALNDFDWPNPILASASKRGFPASLGPSGMKMDGPYDWVPPNYWYETQLGAAYGFGSELGAGVGTPETRSLKKFLSESDMQDLWTNPDKGLYHMSTNVSQFYDRGIYNKALYARYGKPKSLDDYILKSQMMDYEAIRAEFEGYGARWNAERPATGLIYWMLNNAWPSLHWNVFDYYLNPAGSYFGAKVGSRSEHVAYDYVQKAIYIINRSLAKQGARTVEVELIGLDGAVLSKTSAQTESKPNTSKKVSEVPGLDKIKNVAFLRLVLRDSNTVLSRNVYWLSNKADTLNWAGSTWYYTPTTSFADYTSLEALQTASVVAKVNSQGQSGYTVSLENTSKVPAAFIKLALLDGKNESILPVFWSDNYITLWPGEKLDIKVNAPMKGAAIEMTGRNIGPASIISIK